MKHALARYMIAITILALFAAPGHLAAAQGPPRYIAIDMGTFGGPNAYFDIPGQIMNAQGAVIYDGDTSTADPYAPNCFNPDCYLSLGVEWHNGIKTMLGSLPGTNSAAPYSINDSGLIVGGSQNGVINPLTGTPEARAVSWKHGQITDLGTLPGGTESWAFFVNDQGLITGPSSNAVPDTYGCQIFICWATQTRGFVWRDGVMKDIGTLGGPDALPLFINNQGQIVGLSYIKNTPNPDNGPGCSPNAPTMGVFLWQNGTMRNLGSLGGTCTTFGEGSIRVINSSGEVVGQSNPAGNQSFHPFLWTGGKMIDLGTLGGSFGTANWINDAGHVAGWATTAGDETAHGFLWENGRMIDLGTAPGQTCANANVANANDQVVGGSCDSLGDGWLWEHGKMHDLNSLVAPSSVRLAEAHYINDQGEIVCRGVLANGHVHLMLLVPRALAAREGLISNVPAGAPPGAYTSNPHADLNSLLHGSRFRRYRPQAG